MQPVSYSVCTFPTYPTGADCCSDRPTSTTILYLPAGVYVPSTGYVYTDASLTTKYIGNGGYYYFTRGGSAWACKINSSGQIMDMVDCQQ
jgi:amino acid transporter